MNDAMARLERNPITGQQELKRPSTFTPSLMWWLVFSEGTVAWNALDDAERMLLEGFARQEWLTACRNNKKIAATFFGNILININTLKRPMPGEHCGD